MSRTLSLGTTAGKAFRLPIDAVTETFAILAKKRAGKSNGAVVMYEGMRDLGVPVIAIDPKGDWWGVRAGADGDAEGGLDVIVFGGLHGDLPIEPTEAAANLIADLIVDERVSAVLDVSEFTKGEQRRFLTPFALRLLRRNREPLHVFVDEAHEILPQGVERSDAELLGAWSKLVKQGGFRGIGVTMVSQRSASLNKGVLTQIDTLIVLRTTAPTDRNVVRDWVRSHADDAAELLDSLPSLRDGEAWVWSPEFLGSTTRIQFRRRRTFDSGSTPKVGESRQEPKGLRDVDIAAFEEAMAGAIERHEANDPMALKKQLAQRDREIAELRRTAADTKPVEQTSVEVIREVEVLTPPVIPTAFKEVMDTHREVAEATVEMGRALADTGETMLRNAELMQEALDNNDAEWDRFLSERLNAPGTPDRTTQGTKTPPKSAAPAPAQASRPLPKGTPDGTPDGAEDVPIGKTEQNVLSVLAQFPEGRTKDQIAMLAGYSAKASTVGVALSRLRRVGWVTPGGTANIQITELGMANATFEPLPTGPALLEFWKGHKSLGQTEINVLEHLMAVWPNTTDKQATADATGYSAAASTIGVALSRLRKVGLVDGWKASDDFMAAIA